MARQVKGTHKPKLRVGSLHGRTTVHGPTAHLHGRQSSKKAVFNKALHLFSHPNRIANPHGKTKTKHVVKTATHPPHPVP